MFSSRLNWSSPENRIAVLLRQKRAGKAEILDLTISNPTEAALEYPIERIRSAISQGGILRYEPDARGSEHARAAVAEYYSGAVSPENIVLTASTSEAYSYLFKLLADAGDEVLVPRPSYPLFEYLAALELVRPVQYPLEYDHGWRIDFEELRSLVTPRTRAVVIVNPNNPTGSYIARGELEELTALAVERDLAIISDEVFADYNFGEDSGSVRSVAGMQGPLSFSLSGLSKISALPQMKLGWIVVNGPGAEAMKRLELIVDTFLPVSAPVQAAAGELLAVRTEMQTQIRARTAANLKFLWNATAASPCRPLQVQGGWYAILQLPRTQSEEEWILRLLGDYDVLAQPGYFYDFDREAFAVLSLLTPESVFREGAARIAAAAMA